MLEELYLKAGDGHQRIVAIGTEAVVTLVEGRLITHPLEGATVLHWWEINENEGK